MTVGYFAPDSRQRTGVADYAAVLLPALTQRLTVNVNDARASVPLYHLGNNKLHAEIYRKALTKPGVIILHDAVLHHFLLGQLSRSEYLDEFVYNYGNWTAQLAKDLWDRRALSGVDGEYFKWPMIRRVVERSLAVVVHSERAREEALRHVSDARVAVIPHYFVHPGKVEPELLPTAEGSVVAAVLGHLRETKRVLPVLRVFSRLVQSGLPTSLLLAGECTSTILSRAIDGTAVPMVRLGYLDAPRWWRVAQSVDICINLRYPSAGETSGIGIRMMGLGKPVICSDGEEVCANSACIPISSGLTEEDELTAVLTWLVQYAKDRRDIGLRAAEHIAREHNLNTVADRYVRVLREAKA